VSSRATPFPAQLEAFVELFNRGAFWESHEVLEGEWRRTGSDFYHGLILYASAFVHVQRGNAHGTDAQLAKAERVLGQFGSTYLGVDIAALLSHGRACRKIVLRSRSAPGDQWMDIIRLPKIRLRAEQLAGNEPELTTG
jgi:hypothetical protein